MKQIFTLILGDLGLFLVGTVTSIASWFLFPLFVSVLNASNPFSSIIGWLLIAPISLGIYISSIFTSISLVSRGIKSKKWIWLCLGILLLVFDIVIVIKSLI